MDQVVTGTCAVLCAIVALGCLLLKRSELLFLVALNGVGVCMMAFNSEDLSTRGAGMSVVATAIVLYATFRVWRIDHDRIDRPGGTVG